MDKVSLLAKIWNEKREKIVSDKIHPLGIGIFLGNPCFNAHEIIYGLISFLSSDPERSLIWSQNWGRTNVLLGRYNFPQFKFLMRESDEEKSLIPVSTKRQLDPRMLIVPDMNYGHFKILLNFEETSIEGAILQVERMVDELIWCLFLRIRDSMSSFDIETPNLPRIYSRAIDIAWRGGVVVDYVPETQILELKERNMEVPVRVYGNRRGNQTVPNIIGAVLIPDNLEVNRELVYKVEVCRVNALARVATREIVVSQIQGSLPEPAGGLFVCAGVTLGKIPHTGHLLLLTYADTVRRILCPGTPLYIESNDTGPRIAGMIAKMAGELGVSVNMVIKLLCANRITIEVIERCYRDREQFGDIVEVAEGILSVGGFDILSTIRNRFLESMRQFGFGDIVVIPDSDCFIELDDFMTKISGSLWSQYGFYFTTHRKQGGHIQTLVHKEKGIPSSCATRVSFIKKVFSLENPKSLAVYVDRDRSVSDAVTALREIERYSMIQFHGTSIGFKFKMVSGSAGDSVAINTLYEAFLAMPYREVKPSFIQALRFFIFTRYETTEGKRTHPHRSEIIGSTFYDYRDHKAFFDDFALCVNECADFLVLLSNAKHWLITETNNAIDGEEENKEYTHFVQQAFQVLHESSLNKIFPPVRQVIPNLFFRQIYDQMMSKVVYGRENCFDTVLADGFLSGVDSAGALSDFMLAHGVLESSIRRNREETVTCLYIDNLRSRGYKHHEIKEFAPFYFDGRMLLVRRKCLFFEILKNVLGIIQKTKRTSTIATELLTILSEFEKKLGFEFPN